MQGVLVKWLRVQKDIYFSYRNLSPSPSKPQQKHICTQANKDKWDDKVDRISNIAASNIIFIHVNIFYMKVKVKEKRKKEIKRRTVHNSSSTYWHPQPRWSKILYSLPSNHIF
jgi:hypothetical protein